MFSKQIFWKQYKSIIRHSVGPDLDLNCLQGSAADDEKLQLAGKELCTCTYTCFVFVFCFFFAVIVIYVLLLIQSKCPQLCHLK